MGRLTVVLLLPASVACTSTPRNREDVAALNIPDSTVEIPGGTYTIGCSSLPMCLGNPTRKVTVRSFAIDRFQVRDEAYVKCERSLSCPQHWYFSLGVRDSDEVAVVRTAEATAFCRWKGGHLTSAIEWEIAGRGNDARLYPWGNSWSADRLSRHGINRVFHIRKDYARVGTRPDLSSMFGVEDMSGNVPEFVYRGVAFEQRGAPSLYFKDHLHTEVTAADYSLVMTHSVFANTVAAFRCAY